MTVRPRQPSGSVPRPTRRLCAFTLTEVMVASSVFLLVVGGVIAGHVFGMRLLEPVNARQRAADQARELMSTLASEVRAARTVRVGSGAAGVFYAAAANTPQLGSALQLYPTTNANQFVRYFRDPATAALLRISSGSTAVTPVAQAIANSTPFSLQDFQGRILTNNQMNAVVGIDLEFSEVGPSGSRIGPGRFFRAYAWNTQIHRRTLQ